MYSQNCEEKYILEYFGDRKGKFLDIGSHDGMLNSNTYALALLGWQGVCIEPSASPFHVLTNLYQDNENITLINAALITDDVDYGLIKFYESGGDQIGTLYDKHKEVWDHYTKYRDIYISPIKMRDIYSQFGNDFSFISIDIEGGNVDLLKDLDLFFADMVCIEHDRAFNEILECAAKFELHEIYRSNENMILARDSA